MTNLNLGLIGNCSYGGLIDEKGRVVWMCLPRFDGDPVFCSLLNGNGQDNGNGNDEKFGFFEIEIKDFSHSEQHYVRNTAILVTTLYDISGAGVEVTDFAPRFNQFGRSFRPNMMVRQLRPVGGTPTISIRIRPRFGYGAHAPECTHGSNHIRYVSPGLTLRLTTNAPISFVLDETPFLLDRPHTLILGPDESLTRAIPETARDFLEKTIEYWQEFVRGLSIPFEWQEAVIRAAITLKLSSFEETGAIIAAMTTSIPEEADTARNWDYRYCWLRDSYFVVNTLYRLGASATMEEYLQYILNIVALTGDQHLQPVYGIALEKHLTESEVPHLSGYRGMGPVRVGNQAYKQMQNDVYGSVILAAAHSFLDQRLRWPGTPQLLERLESLGENAFLLYDQPDAGLWELRNRARVHTFSSIMCWVTCDRLAKISLLFGLEERFRYWQERAVVIRDTILKEAWNEEKGTFVESFGGSDLDASLLLMADLHLIDAGDPRFRGTVEAIERELKQGVYLLRYSAADDFGEPGNAFTICTFWYIDALAALGRTEEARELFEHMLSKRNPLGLLSEDLDPNTGELWGNFPQTYSMVGLITSAMRLSKTWEEAF